MKLTMLKETWRSEQIRNRLARLFARVAAVTLVMAGFTALLLLLAFLLGSFGSWLSGEPRTILVRGIYGLAAMSLASLFSAWFRVVRSCWRLTH
jgi:hypothetical protein